MKIALTTLLTCLFLLSPAVAQESSTPSPVKPSDFADAKPSNCPDRTANLDGIAQSTTAGELIIVIARSGDGDTKAGLSRRRLHNVRAYWLEYLPAVYRLRPESIILAEGERIGGFGQLEFYVGGKLIWADKVARNADLRVGECYPPDDSYIRNGFFNPCEVRSNRIFYPCRELIERRRRRR